MATSAFVLMSLLSNQNIVTSMFDIDRLKAQEKNRLQQFKKEQRDHKLCQAKEYKAYMFNSKMKQIHNLNSFKYYLNYNIKKDAKR